MQTNQFENSRIAEGTMRPGAQHVSSVAPTRAESPQNEGGKGFADTAFPDTPGKPMRRVLDSAALTGYRVRNNAGDDLGKIEEIMIDMAGGRVAYAVLSHGGFLGIGDKLLMIPWNALTVDQSAHEFVLGVSRRDLEKAPAFERSHWPNLDQPAAAEEIHRYYERILSREPSSD